jgi:hypothetical protein
MGPTLIFDKSLLQSLNPDESALLDHFFLCNITPSCREAEYVSPDSAWRKIGHRVTPYELLTNLFRSDAACLR